MGQFDSYMAFIHLTDTVSSISIITVLHLNDLIEV